MQGIIIHFSDYISKGKIVFPYMEGFVPPPGQSLFKTFFEDILEDLACYFWKIDGLDSFSSPDGYIFTDDEIDLLDSDWFYDQLFLYSRPGFLFPQYAYIIDDNDENELFGFLNEPSSNIMQVFADKRIPVDYFEKSVEFIEKNVDIYMYTTDANYWALFSKNPDLINKLSEPIHKKILPDHIELLTFLEFSKIYSRFR